jgi:hypothetical protein
VEDSYAKIFWSIDPCTDAGDGVDPSVADEKKRDRSNEFWQNR